MLHHFFVNLINSGHSGELKIISAVQIEDASNIPISEPEEVGLHPALETWVLTHNSVKCCKNIALCAVI